MNLKTSFFNATLFRANIKRFWWIAAILFIAFLSFGILPLINYSSAEGFMIMSVISCVIAAILPTILFSYLDFPAQVTCMHSFPIKRKAHFVTNIVTLYAIILIPAAICYVIGGVYILSSSVILSSPVKTIFEFFKMLPILIMLVTIFSSGAVLANMVTGNPISAIAFSALFIGLPYYSELLFAQFLQENIYGIWDYNTSINLSLTEFTPYLLISFIIWAIVLVLSWFLYKHRRLETNGDIISFKFLKPVFTAGVSIFLGLLGYFYLTAILDTKSIFFMLPFGLLGIVISNMLIKKLLTFRGCLKPGIIYIIGVILVYAIITFDLTGYEHRIPDMDDIASVSIVSDSYNKRYGEENLAYWVNGEKYYFTDFPDPAELHFKEQKDIKNVIAMHQALIENKGIKDDNHDYIPIKYTLKNGKSLKRKYYINYRRDKAVLIPVYETKQMRLNKYDIFRDFEKTIVDVAITDKRILGDNTTFNIYSGDDEKAKQLLRCIEADILRSKYENIIRYNDTATKIRITYMRPAVTKDNKPYNIDEDNGAFSESITIGIPSSFTETTQLLEEYGLYEKIAKPEQIGYLTVNFDEKSGDNSQTTITDAEQIKDIYNLCYNPVYTTENNSNYPVSADYISVDFYGKNNNHLLNTNYSFADDYGLVEYPAVIIYEAKKWTTSAGSFKNAETTLPKAEITQVSDY